MLKDKIAKVEEEIKNVLKAMDVCKEQIMIYNKKGQELAAHGNVLKGKLEALKEIEAEEGE